MDLVQQGESVFSKVSEMYLHPTKTRLHGFIVAWVEVKANLVMKGANKVLLYEVKCTGRL